MCLINLQALSIIEYSKFSQGVTFKNEVPCLDTKQAIKVALTKVMNSSKYMAYMNIIDNIGG